VPHLRFLDSAKDDLGEIAGYIAASGGTQAAVRFTGEITVKCEHLATLPGLLGRARPELRADIRSIPFKGYIIFFRYLPSDTNREIMEIVDIVEGHRDFDALFNDD